MERACITYEHYLPPWYTIVLVYCLKYELKNSEIFTSVYFCTNVWHITSACIVVYHTRGECKYVVGGGWNIIVVMGGGDSE